MIEFTSATWRVIEDHCNEQIELAIERLVQPGRPELDTERDRGSITALKAILSLSKVDDGNKKAVVDTDY